MLLIKVKLALRLTTDAFNSELQDLIEAAKADIETTGSEYRDGDPLMERAVVTYCRLNFGSPDDYDRLKVSYDEQKAQIRMNGRYRNG